MKGRQEYLTSNVGYFKKEFLFPFTVNFSVFLRLGK